MSDFTTVKDHTVWAVICDRYHDGNVDTSLMGVFTSEPAADAAIAENEAVPNQLDIVPRYWKVAVLLNHWKVHI